MTTEPQELGADHVSVPRPKPIRKRKYSQTTYRSRIILPALGVRWQRDYNDYVLLKGNRELGRVIPGPYASIWVPLFYFGDLKKLPIFGKHPARNACVRYGDHTNLTRAKDAIRVHAEALLIERANNAA